MNIIIDTNIFRADLLLKNKHFEFAQDYLDKTDSRFVLPRIVLEEVLNQYSIVLNQSIAKVNNSISKLNSLTLADKLPEAKTLDSVAEVRAYEVYILDRLRISAGSIVDYKNEYLPELVRRAVNKVKPLGADGQQFRDGVLWFTILDIAVMEDSSEIIFISDNKNDFCAPDAKSLSDELKVEADARGVTIHFYRNLSDFAEGHASRIDFLNEGWITANADFSKMEEMFGRILDAEERAILKSFEKPRWRDEFRIESIESTGYVNSLLRSYFVNEFLNGTLLLHLEIELEAEYEVTRVREGESESGHMKMVAKYDPIHDDFDFEPEFVPPSIPTSEHKHDYEHPIFVARFILTIIGGEITEYSIEEWDWG